VEEIDRVSKLKPRSFIKYTKQDFGRDLFFYIGALSMAIDQHNKSWFVKNRMSEERFEQFREYCFKRFSKKGVIKG